jgi:hypothetical protein
LFGSCFLELNFFWAAGGLASPIFFAEAPARWARRACLAGFALLKLRESEARRACHAGKAGFPFVVASCRLFFCRQPLGFFYQPKPANKKICRHFSKLPLQSLLRVSIPIPSIFIIGYFTCLAGKAGIGLFCCIWFPAKRL